VTDGADIPVRAVGLIDDPLEANAIVADGRADIHDIYDASLAAAELVHRRTPGTPGGA